AGLLLLIIPGVWMAVMFSMTPQVMALEDRGILGSLRRSTRLVAGRWWATLGFLLIVALLGSIAGQLIQLVALPVVAVAGVDASAALGFVISVLVQGLLIAAIAVMTSIWYVDLRSRKEDLTTESLS
ncbi:MAG: hypothetical protein ACR2NL_13075, partial [Acidimicrobiia bacterium]